MTNERYHAVFEDEEELTLTEMLQGWHFCHEFDGLLVGPDMGEMQFCTCPGIKETMRDTFPMNEADVDAFLKAHNIDPTETIEKVLEIVRKARSA